VALVYDVMDTEGRELPKDVAAFFAQGPVGEGSLARFRILLGKKNIHWHDLDAGDARAGWIRCEYRANEIDERSTYKMMVNTNHSPAVQFATLAHEMGHLFLGHLGRDDCLGAPERPPLSQQQEELEAESVAYVVCKRNGITSRSETYLAKSVTTNTTIGHLDVDQVMRAAGHVETLLGLGAQTRVTAPPKRRR
jgi:IrrE N-terminal-like domain